MKETPVTLTDLHGVFAVPPLCRKLGPRRAIDFADQRATLEPEGRRLDAARRDALVGRGL